MRILNQRPKVIDKYELSRYSTKPPSLFALGRSHTEKIGMKPKVTKRHGSNLITITVEPISQKIGARRSFPASSSARRIAFPLPRNFQSLYSRKTFSNWITESTPQNHDTLFVERGLFAAKAQCGISEGESD